MEGVGQKDVPSVGTQGRTNCVLGIRSSYHSTKNYSFLTAFVGGAPDSSFRAFSLHPLQKSKNQKIRKSQKGNLRNDFRDAAQPRYKSQKWQAKNSCFEGHEVL